MQSSTNTNQWKNICKSIGVGWKNGLTRVNFTVYSQWSSKFRLTIHLRYGAHRLDRRTARHVIYMLLICKQSSIAKVFLKIWRLISVPTSTRPSVSQDYNEKMKIDWHHFGVLQPMSANTLMLTAVARSPNLKASFRLRLLDQTCRSATKRWRGRRIWWRGLHLLK